MRDWQHDAPKMIAAIHEDNFGCTTDELRKVLRKEAGNFHCGTSWGKRVWSKHCKAYLAKMAGKGLTPNDSKAVEWPADIAFPFGTEISA